MRKGVLVAGIVLVFLLSFVSAIYITGKISTDISSTGCTDSEGGNNPYILGTLTISGNSNILEDFCSIKIGENSYLSNSSCDGVDCYIQETWCDSPSKEYQLFPSDYIECPKGCQDGACIKICTDSDKGADYYIKGEATGPVPITNEIVTLTDHCFNDTVLNEAVCGEDGYTGWSVYTCPNICKEGICILGKINQPEEEGGVLTCKDTYSCPLDNKCYPFGYRKSEKYCSDSGNFIEQLRAGNPCDNNFECDSNVCVNGSCVSGSFIQRIIEWFRKLFGAE